jgi:hypothetical protein
MKIIEFKNLIDECKVNYFKEHKKIYIKDLNFKFNNLNKILEKIEIKKDPHFDNFYMYLPVWFKIEKESDEEIIEIIKKDQSDHNSNFSLDGEELKEELEFLKETNDFEHYWFKCKISKYDNYNQETIIIGDDAFTCNLKESYVILSEDYDENGNQIEFLIDTLISKLENEYKLLSENKSEYYKSKKVDNKFNYCLIDYKKAFKKIKNNNKITNYLNKETNKNIRNKFVDIKTSNFGEGIQLTKNKYLKLAFDCLLATGREIENLSLEECYKKCFDGRDGGLLDLDGDDPVAFDKWFSSRDWHGSHPFEIIRGASSRDLVCLSPQYKDGLYTFSLHGEHQRRMPSIIKMCVHLYENKISFDYSSFKYIKQIIEKDFYIGVSPISGLYMTDVKTFPALKGYKNINDAFSYHDVDYLDESFFIQYPLDYLDD